MHIDIVQELSEEIEDSLDVKALWHAKYVELEADDNSYLLGDPGAILGPLQTAGALNPVEYRALKDEFASQAKQSSALWEWVGSQVTKASQEGIVNFKNYAYLSDGKLQESALVRVNILEV